MWHLRSRIPRGTLSRTRLAGLVIGMAAAASQFAQIGNPERSPQYLRLSAATLATLLAALLFTHLRGRSSWWTVPVVPVLLVFTGSGLVDPLASTALALGSTVVLSFYGSHVEWAVRVLGAGVAIPASVAVSPSSAGRDVSWHDGVVLNLLPQLILMAALARGVYLSLRRQERDMARESLLARAGLAMLGVTDVDKIREVGRRTAEEIVALNPGIAMLIVRRDPDGLYVANLAGAPAAMRGRRVVLQQDFFASLLPDYRDWHIDELGGDGDVYLVVAGARSVPPDVRDAFRNLSHQVMLAENGCRAHAELEHSAHHDHLTQLPNRAKFLRAAADAVATATPGSVALLNVDLDDFKKINDGHGHAAGDEVLVQTAARLAEVAAGHGVAGRFGGDEFALLITDLTTPAEASGLAELLCARLAAPVVLSGGAAVTVGASIGVAVTAPGVTLADLSRRADIAMYSAKAQGKNRVELYAPADHRLAA